MVNPEITYRYSSMWQFAYSLLKRIGSLCLIGYFIYHYDENPILIIILCIVCLWLFFALGNDEILVNKQLIRQVDTSIISYFRKSETVYELKKHKASLLARK